MPPQRFLDWCAQLPPGSVVAMETCGGAHRVARRLQLLGLDARLVAGHFVTPYRTAGESGKNDANDAAAICEAAGRAHMRFVAVKTAEQQGQLTVRTNCSTSVSSGSALHFLQQREQLALLRDSELHHADLLVVSHNDNDHIVLPLRSACSTA